MKIGVFFRDKGNCVTNKIMENEKGNKTIMKDRKRQDNKEMCM